jgi:hypothetical protein
MPNQLLNYQSPEVQVIDICAENVICQSLSFEDGSIDSLLKDLESSFPNIN